MSYGRSKMITRGSSWSCVDSPALLTSYVAMAKAEKKCGCCHQPLLCSGLAPQSHQVSPGLSCPSEQFLVWSHQLPFSCPS